MPFTAASWSLSASRSWLTATFSGTMAAWVYCPPLQRTVANPPPSVQAAHCLGWPVGQIVLSCHRSAGGLMDFAYSFIMRNGGIDTEDDYKYKAIKGQCNVNKEDRHVVTIDGYEDVPANDEVALAKVRAKSDAYLLVSYSHRGAASQEVLCTYFLHAARRL